MNEMKADYNKLMYLKNEMEELYIYFKEAHDEMLKLFENGECIDDEKLDKFHSDVKEYESTLDLLKSNFLLLKSNNKKIESNLNQTKLLKKKRLSKIESNMDKYKRYNNDDFNLDSLDSPF